jgi:hypothetical protein
MTLFFQKQKEENCDNCANVNGRLPQIRIEVVSCSIKTDMELWWVLEEQIGLLLLLSWIIQHHMP